MWNDAGAGYLSGLPESQRAALARVNQPGFAKLREYLDAGDPLAFLGAGASLPLYPLWAALIRHLVDAAAHRLTKEEAAACRALAVHSPEEIVEILRRRLGPASYWEILRSALLPRTDPATGWSWTPVHELVCRCAFKGVITTNYDTGIVDARLRVRPGLSATGFTIWNDQLGLDRWRTGRVFRETELPVLFAHGYYNQPDSVVLATTEYRRAYEGKLGRVLGRLVDGGPMVWIGFSFADQRIAAILREVALWSGTVAEPGAAPEHIAIMPWDPAAEGNDPGILSLRAEISYGAMLILYPAPNGDHSALRALLSSFTDRRFPPVLELLSVTRTATVSPAPGTGPGSTVPVPKEEFPPLPVSWQLEGGPGGGFIGRAEELNRLDRWAEDPQVSLIGVTAWGGAGKTTLVSHWVLSAGGAVRAGVRGVFGWGFYADPSVEHWADALLTWAAQEFGVRVPASRPAAAILDLLRQIPIMLVLDGLEVIQEGPAGTGFGRLLDGALREVLAGVCTFGHAGLVVLTSRFPFADLEAFDGTSARTLEVPPFTPAEGSALLAAASGNSLDDAERRSLVRAVDGHALAVGVLASTLGDRPSVADLEVLRGELTGEEPTTARVNRVLRFSADRLSEPDRYLVAAVSLFARPVSADVVLAVASHKAFRGHLAGWTHATVETAVRERLGGLVSWHADSGAVSAHPLVRDVFRPLVLGAAVLAADTSLAGLPDGQVAGRADLLRVVEVIEMLLDANQWKPADDLFARRTGSGRVFLDLPAASLGQRAASAFVMTPARRAACAAQLGLRNLGFFLNEAGINALAAGDLVTAQEYLRGSIQQNRGAAENADLSINLANLSACLGMLGDTSQARAVAAESVAVAEQAADPSEVPPCLARLGWAADLAGDGAAAEGFFIRADQVAFDSSSRHMHSASGIYWAERLSRTGRGGPAKVLAEQIREGTKTGAGDAWCQRLLGRLALADGRTATAGAHLAGAAERFREGDVLAELAIVLADLAGWAQTAGDFDAAERHAAEAIAVASPRGLVPAQSAALAARARIRAGQFEVSASADLLAQGRDAADAALRLATRHHLAWHELTALRAHAELDRAESASHGWDTRAAELHARLVPPGLDPDPLATVQARAGVPRKRAKRSGRRQRP
jgi:tetratricopeptide (TPR) repeat protein